MIPPFVRRRLGGLSSAAAIRIGGRGLVFLVALILARELGVEGFGIYSFATTWVAVLLIISGLGYGNLMLRQTAVYVERDRPDLLQGLIRTARRTIIPLSVALILAAAAAAALFFDPIFLIPLLIALPSVVIRTSALVWDGVLMGLGRVDEGFIPSLIIYPAVMLAGVGGVLVVAGSLTPESAVAIYVVAFAVATGVSWLLARRRLRPITQGVAERAAPEEGRFFLLMPFTLLAMVNTVSASIGAILLGLLDFPDAVGTFSAALKLVEPMILVFGVVNLSLSARLAALHARGEVAQLRPAIARNIRLSLVWAAPVGLVLVLFPDFVLGLFGAGFEGGATPLLLLVPATLFSILAGIGPAALMMTDHQREAIVAKGFGLALNVFLCLALIPSHGASGAAFALAVDIVAANLIAVVLAWKLLGLNTTGLSLPGRLTGTR